MSHLPLTRNNPSDKRVLYTHLQRAPIAAPNCSLLPFALPLPDRLFWGFSGHIFFNPPLT